MADILAPQATPPAPTQTPTPPSLPQAQAPAELPGAPADDEKFFAALGYFGPLFVLPLIAKPQSPFCKFHARQSMVLFLIFIVFLMVLFMIPWFGSLMTFALFATYVLAIYKAYSGELWGIPLISSLAGKMNVDALYNKAGLAVSGIANFKETAQTLADKATQAAQSLGGQEEKKPETKPEVPQTLPPQPENKTPPPPQA